MGFSVAASNLFLAGKRYVEQAVYRCSDSLIWSVNQMMMMTMMRLSEKRQVVQMKNQVLLNPPLSSLLSSYKQTKNSSLS